MKSSTGTSAPAYALYIEYNLSASRGKFRGFYHLTQHSQVGTLKQCQEMKNRLDAGQSTYLKIEIVKLFPPITVEDLESTFDTIK
jgi:hypothetical protein